MKYMSFICMIMVGFTATVGIAKNSSPEPKIYIKNSSDRSIFVSFWNKDNKFIYQSRQILPNDFLITASAKEAKEYLQQIDKIEIEYAPQDDKLTTVSKKLKKYAVKIQPDLNTYDKIYVKFKVDVNKQGYDVPSFQPQKGIFGKTQGAKPSYSLKGNIKNTDMTPVTNNADEDNGTSGKKIQLDFVRPDFSKQSN